MTTHDDKMAQAALALLDRESTAVARLLIGRRTAIRILARHYAVADEGARARDLAEALLALLFPYDSLDRLRAEPHRADEIANEAL